MQIKVMRPTNRNHIRWTILAMIQLTSDVTTDVNGSQYRYVELATEKTGVSVTIAADHVRVVVLNAAHRVWGGAGKRFETMADAINNYKNAAVKEMLASLVTA
jgi:hypothetical protein